MMTEEVATRYIHDTVIRMTRTRHRPTMVMVHPDYHLLVARAASEHGLRLILNPETPLDRFFFR